MADNALKHRQLALSRSHVLQHIMTLSPHRRERIAIAHNRAIEAVDCLAAEIAFPGGLPRLTNLVQFWKRFLFDMTSGGGQAGASSISKGGEVALPPPPI